MFIKRNRRISGDGKVTAVLLVHGERVQEKRPPGRPAKDAPPPKTKVVHRTLANLTKLPENLVSLIEAYCRGEAIGRVDAKAVVGPGYGQVAATYAIAKEIGLVDALGPSRRGKLALFLVLARICARGSRLSSMRWAANHAIAQVLDLGPFDEEDLLETLTWLEGEQPRIETALARRRPVSALYLYDVSSSYFEGQKNELAAPGYSRDGKRFKKQIVYGLLTDETGDPVAIRVYKGNTSDPLTVDDQIQFLSKNIGAKEIVFVGDRGMVKANPRSSIAREGYRFLTALTDPQVRTLLKKKSIQLDLFDETPAEVEADDRRFILRLNPATRDRDRQRRADQLSKVQAKVDRRNEVVRNSERADPTASLTQAEKSLRGYKLDRFVSARLEDRKVVLVIDESKRADVEMLDGCYVLETDVPKEVMDAATAHERYMDLTKVERDFRTLKSGLLEIRPIFVRRADRTRGHALVSMLALKVARVLEKRIRPLGITVIDALERLAAVRLVTYADPDLELWHLPSCFPALQRQVLDCLPPLPTPLLSPPARPSPRSK